MGNYAPIHPLCVTLLLTVVKFHKSTLIHSNHGLAANPGPFSGKIPSLLTGSCCGKPKFGATQFRYAHKFTGSITPGVPEIYAS